MSRPSNHVRASLALIGANAIWGTSFVATKPVLDHVPPLTLALVRFVIALAILWPIVIRAGGRPRFDRSSALLGFTGVFCFYVAQNVGLRFTSATNATLIQGGVPVLTVLLAAACLGERLRPIRLVGVGLSLVAVIGIVLTGGEAKAGVSWRGDLLLAASAASFALYLVIGRRVFERRPGLATLTGSIGWGVLFLVPAAGAEALTGDVAVVSPRDAALLLYLGVGCSGLAFVLWAYGLRHLNAGRAAVFGNLNPLVGVFAALALGEPLTAPVLVGGALLLAGIWLANRHGRPSGQVPAAGDGDGAAQGDLAQVVVLRPTTRSVPARLSCVSVQPRWLAVAPRRSSS